MTVEKTQMRQALDRADKLINWMMEYVGQMAPGKYSECFSDLNEHCLFMERLKWAEKQAGLVTK